MAEQDRVGARIAVIRKTRGWTARELARRAHVSYSLLAKVESGAAPASSGVNRGRGAGTASGRAKRSPASPMRSRQARRRGCTSRLS